MGVIYGRCCQCQCGGKVTLTTTLVSSATRASEQSENNAARLARMSFLSSRIADLRAA